MDVLDQDAPALSPNDTESLVKPVVNMFSAALMLGSVALQAVLGRVGAKRQPLVLRRPVDSFINTETPIALEQLLCNIGADGCNARAATPGVVIASPSTWDPDYGALVFKAVVDRFVAQYDAVLQRHIQEYIAAQVRLQTVSSPSGSLADGQGLGEPKYLPDIGAFTGSWGRPQRDGPALRATAMIAYANWLVDNGYSATASTLVWPVVRNDLEYVAQYWNQTGFDLWEEVNGSSFFTISSQYRALAEGSRLAASLGEPASSYAAIAPHVLCFLQTFWVASEGFVVANINLDVSHGRAGKDANTILAPIHAFDPALGCDAATFQPCSDRALANHKATVDSFRTYSINKGAGRGKAAAVGRYIEDVYYGGNPWYLTTLAAAEQLYDAVYVWKQAGSVAVTDTSLAFFRDLVPGAAVGTYSRGSSAFAAIVDAVSDYADGFVAVAAAYTATNGSLAEQYSRDDGRPLSARDLTWSYAALLTAAARRAGVVPPSWSAGSAPSLPQTCLATSAAGSYAPATVTSFPPSQTPVTGTPTTSAPACKTATAVAVTFRAMARTAYGQTIKMVGSADALGGWDTGRAVALDASEYAPASPVWKATVTLAAGDVVQYKYINVGPDGRLVWERGPDHTYAVPRSCATTVPRSDKWQS